MSRSDRVLGRELPRARGTDQPLLHPLPSAIAGMIQADAIVRSLLADAAGPLAALATAMSDWVRPIKGLEDNEDNLVSPGSLTRIGDDTWVPWSLG